ncbi:MAG: hypothetical protein U1F16_10330 [Turneriella sp.]
MRPLRTLKNILTAPLYAIAAVIVLLEDWLWDDLQRIAAWIGHLPVLRQLESLIVRAPRSVALLMFLFPSLILIPVKLLALYFISGGHALIGVVTIIGAKIAGTALVARLFTLTKPKLLTFTWFGWCYERIVAFKSRVYTFIKSSLVYQAVHGALTRFRVAWRTAWQRWFDDRERRTNWLRRRWQALLRYLRRADTAPISATSAHITNGQGDGESPGKRARREKRASQSDYSGVRRAKKSPRSRAKSAKPRS